MKILKNYLYTITYQILLIIVPIITVPYISRVLGASNVGLNAYTLSIISYFSLFANLGLSMYGNREIAYVKEDKNKRSKIFWEIVILKLLMMFLTIIIFTLFLNITTDYKLILLVQSIQLLAVGIDISWYFTGTENFKKTVTRNIFVKIISICLMFLFVKNENDLLIYILINVLSNVFGNVTLWSYMYKQIKFIKLKQLNFKLHLIPIIVLFIPQLSTSIFMTINRLYLGNLSTLTQTGFYDNADKIIRIFLAFITSVGTVLFPKIANSFYNNESQKLNDIIKIAFNVVSVVSFPIVFGIIAVSRPFSSVFYGKNFNGIDVVLAIMAVQLIFMGWSSIIGQQYMVAINKIKGLNISMIAAVIFQLIGSYFFVKSYGAIGAAIMAVFSEGIIVFTQFMFIKKYINISSLFNECWKYLFGSIIMLLICKIANNILHTSDILTVLVEVSLGIIVYGIIIFKLKVSIFNDLKQIIKKV